jgi:hypothetical protein
MNNKKRLFEVNKRKRCSCGDKAVTWLDDGTPLCRECALDQMLTLLQCGISVTLKADSGLDRVITPPNKFRNQN